MFKELLSNKKGKKMILLGNRAVVRGALESGVQFVTTYPGTPASEVGNTFSKIAKKAGIYFEFSVNEKVALEAAAGAAFSGLKSLVAMKHFGLNVASDFFLPLVYSGTKAPLVLFVADDPSCWSSAQFEENTRGFAYLSHVPILEPSTPQECKEFTKLGFKLSQKFDIPVMIRSTTRVSHQSSTVVLDENKTGKSVLEKVTGSTKKPKGKFIKDPHHFSTMPPRVLRMKEELLEKIEKIQEVSEKSEINRVSNQESSSKIGIITSGVSYLHAMEALEELDLDVPVLKLGFFHPLPKQKIKDFIKNYNTILVIEELEPYLEREIRLLIEETRLETRILGKSHLPQVGELRPEQVIATLADITGKETPLDFEKHYRNFQKLELIKRYPQLCSGCPYWPVFSVIKKIAPEGTIFGGGIGCYMLAAFPPHNIQDYLYCMGSSIGIAHGIKKATNQKLISFIGDSSFFHAGIPALINAVNNKSDPLIVVMDNRTTAMTGQQPHPGTTETGMGEKTVEIAIEPIVRACGVKNVKTIDPHKNLKEFKRTVKDYLDKKEVSVIIVRHPCVYVR